MTRLPQILAQAQAAAIAGGELALASFRPGAGTSAQIWSKAGGSPVTQADIDVDNHLKRACAAALPEAAWLSEETVDDPARIGQRLVWVVDPIDGTRAFLSGSVDWCVCVALLVDDQPALGIVHAPALGLTYAALAGAGAARNGVAISAGPARGLPGARVAGPKPMLEALGGGILLQPKVPSLALRIARIADGQLDGGLISPDARDWDLAAADLILSEAGGRVTTLDGQGLRYNRPDPVHATLVAASGGLHEPLRAAAAARQGRPMFRLPRG